MRGKSLGNNIIIVYLNKQFLATEWIGELTTHYVFV